jgi:hypothetical protein
MTLARYTLDYNLSVYYFRVENGKINVINKEKVDMTPAPAPVFCRGQS